MLYDNNPDKHAKTISPGGSVAFFCLCLIMNKEDKKIKNQCNNKIMTDKFRKCKHCKTSKFALHKYNMSAL